MSEWDSVPIKLYLEKQISGSWAINPPIPELMQQLERNSEFEMITLS